MGRSVRFTVAVEVIVKWLNAQTGWLLLIGGTAMMTLNIYQWRIDQRRIKPVPQYSTIDGTNLPLVSVLVAAWNESDMIADHINSFLRLRYTPKQLVLCAGGDDTTYSIACQYAGDQVIVLEQMPGEGKQKALRRCYQWATGDLMFLTDADCILSDTAFERTIAPLLNGSEQVTTGTIRPLDHQRHKPFVQHRWFTEIYVSSVQDVYSDGLQGANSALTRKAVDAAGAFQPQVRSGTDYYLAKTLLALGYRLHYVADSIIDTEYMESWRTYYHQQRRWLRNVVAQGSQFSSPVEVLKALAPSLIGVWMLLAPLLALVLGPIVLVVWGTMALHALLSRWRYMRFGELKSGYEFSYTWLPFYTAFDFVVWALSVLGRVKW